MAIDNQEINTEADLFKILESRQPGDVIAITAQRYLSVTLMMKSVDFRPRWCSEIGLAGVAVCPVGMVPLASTFKNRHEHPRGWLVL